jgi:hypothetical protein
MYSATKMPKPFYSCGQVEQRISQIYYLLVFSRLFVVQDLKARCHLYIGVGHYLKVLRKIY